jgi:hypothetical protein
MSSGKPHRAFAAGVGEADDGRGDRADTAGDDRAALNRGEALLKEIFRASSAQRCAHSRFLRKFRADILPQHRARTRLQKGLKYDILREM